VVVEFFDDFTQLEPPVTAASAQSALEGLFDLLGWEVAMSEDKRAPFCERFTALGVTVDLAMSASGVVKLSNKSGRVKAIRQQVDSAIESDCIDFRDALSLRGKLSFAEGQNYGRISSPVAHMLSRWSGSLENSWSPAVPRACSLYRPFALPVLCKSDL